MLFALPSRPDAAQSSERLLRLQSIPGSGESAAPPSPPAGPGDLDVGQWVPVASGPDGRADGPVRARGSARFFDQWRARLPEALTGRRLDPGVRGALGLAALAVVAALVAVVLAWRAAPRPASVAVAPPRVEASGTSSGAAAGAAGGHTPAARSSAAAPPLVVDVEGRVLHPGVVRLAAGARVGDAVRAAGGVTAPSSTVGLSMARRLVDGEQIVVGGSGSAAAPPTTGSQSGASAAGADAPSAAAPLDLNAASAAQFDALPGVGPVLAQRIVQWRDQHGGFTSTDQLRQVSGLGGKKGETLMALVRV